MKKLQVFEKFRKIRNLKNYRISVIFVVGPMKFIFLESGDLDGSNEYNHEIFWMNFEFCAFWCILVHFSMQECSYAFFPFFLENPSKSRCEIATVPQSSTVSQMIPMSDPKRVMYDVIDPVTNKSIRWIDIGPIIRRSKEILEDVSEECSRMHQNAL